MATAEDAKIAVDHGVDCVYVSNHGGRQLDQGVGSIDVLPEIAEAVGEHARIIVDGGISRGTDVVKALISGADAVACGRLYVYGLAAGAKGMVRLFEILEDEIGICLSLLGVTGYHELDKTYIRPAARWWSRMSTAPSRTSTSRARGIRRRGPKPPRAQTYAGRWRDGCAGAAAIAAAMLSGRVKARY